MSVTVLEYSKVQEYPTIQVEVRSISINMITLPFPDFKIRVRSSSCSVLFVGKVGVDGGVVLGVGVEAEGVKRRVEEVERGVAEVEREVEGVGGVEGKTYKLGKSWTEAKLKARLKARLERIQALHVLRWKKAMASFSLKELVSLLKSIRSGWGPPLEMAARMLNSKFWVMEADVWADLLIVCCWANPRIYCEKCRKDVESVTTSCNHVVCPVCAVGQGNGLRCPECKQTSTVLVFTSALASKEKPKRKRPLCEPPTTATKRPCTDSGKSMVTRSRSKPAKPRARRKPVSTIPLTAPEVPRPTPPALNGSCSHESQSESLTTDNLDELLEDLYPALNKWYYLGLALGLRHHVLKAIATKQRDDSLDCLREMLITRLDMEKLSKEELIQSLQKQTVGLSKLARMLKDFKQW